MTLILLIGLILPYLLRKVQIREIKISDFVMLVWLGVIFYITLVFTSPYILLSILLSLVILKMLIKSDMWSILMKYTLIISIFIFLFNVLLNTNGSTVLFHWNFIRITLESVVFSLSMILRLEIIMGAFALFNSNVEMEDLITALEKLKLPHKGVITMAIGLRFFPIMLAEAREIVEVSTMRGIPVNSGKISEKVLSRYPILGSMLNITLERAINIGEALETKGYPSNQRNPWKRIDLSKIQIFSILTLLSFSIIATIHALIFGTYQFYPFLSPFTHRDVIFSLLSFIFPLFLLCGQVSRYD